MGMEANHVLSMNGVKTAVIDPHSRKKEEEIERCRGGHWAVRWRASGIGKGGCGEVCRLGL